MALNIKNLEVERLAAEISSETWETKTQAIKRALEDRRNRLAGDRRKGNGDRGERLMRFLELEVWPRIPRKELGRRLTKREHDKILGYGKDGV